MPIICSGCGEVTEPEVDRTLSAFVCALCQHRAPTRLLPLFIVTGASGSGKSAVVDPLRGALPECGVFDVDAIWLNKTDHDLNTWFLLAHGLAQSGRSSVLCGYVMPWDVARCLCHRYFSSIEYIILHCADDVRVQRLQARKPWRRFDDKLIQQHLELSHWWVANVSTFDPPLPLIDTSTASATDVSRQVASVVRAYQPKS